MSLEVGRYYQDGYRSWEAMSGRAKKFRDNAKQHLEVRSTTSLGGFGVLALQERSSVVTTSLMSLTNCLRCVFDKMSQRQNGS